MANDEPGTAEERNNRTGNGRNSEETPLANNGIRQGTIWDIPEVVGPDPAGIVVIPQEDDNQVTWTKDITSLADVPVASTANVRRIEVLKTGQDGTVYKNFEDGKIILRRCPHPDFVRVGDRVVNRANLTDAMPKKEQHPIMMDCVTTILYTGGVVLPIHLDVLHALLHQLLARWQATGQSLGPLKTTRGEIAEIICQSINGRVRDHIDAALDTLKGLRIIKTYRSSKEDDVETTQHIGGLISNYTVHRVGKNDYIEVNLNSAIISAMTAGADQRQWSLRTLNFSKTLRFTEHWRRQLYRLLDSRFQATGYLHMPIKELWIGCLGHDEADARDPARWRKARYRLKGALEEFEKTGYLTDLQFITRRLKTGPKPKAKVMARINLESGETADLDAEAPYSLDGEPEWIKCNPGPSFVTESPKRTKEFAVDLVEALTGEPKKAPALVKTLGEDVVVTVINDRMKAAIRETGELFRRLPQTGWLSSSYPTATLAYLQTHFHTEHERRVSSQAAQHEYRPLDAPFFHRRQAILRQRVASSLARDGLDIRKIFEGKTAENPKLQEIVQNLQQTARYLARRHNIEEAIFLEDARLYRPELARAWDQLVTTGAGVALDVAALYHWQSNLENVIAKALTEASTETATGYQNLWRRHMPLLLKEVPKAAGLVAASDTGQRTPGSLSQQNIEQMVAQRIKHRLVEHALELAEIERIERIERQITAKS